MKRNILLLLLLSVINGLALNAQNILKKANNLFAKEQYCEAVFYYNEYLAVHANKDVYFKRGISNYHCRNLDKAIEDIENSIILGNLDKKTNLFLAKSWQDKQEYEKAINYFKLYLVDIFKNKSEKAIILDIIKKCSNGVYHKFRSADHFIENWGREVNTPFHDILPIQSLENNTVFYFGSDRMNLNETKKRYKGYRNEFQNGNWNTTDLLPVNNPEENMIILDILENKQELLFFLGYEIDKGTIFTGNLTDFQIDISSKSKFTGPIMSELGFSYLYYINDSTIVFSSMRPEGYGGYDLYITGTRQGLWFQPVNLGPDVNSEFDEISPFITPDGQQLFFSSNNENSIGGFDVFSSQYYNSSNKWSSPKSLGIPLNSNRDEISFRILSSGMGAIFSSDRKDMGMGGFDNYWLYFKNPKEMSDMSAGEIPFIVNSSLTFLSKSINADSSFPEKTDVYKTAPEPEKIGAADQPVIADKPLPDSNGVTVTENASQYEKNAPFDSLILIIPMIFFEEDEFNDNSLLSKFMDQLAVLMMKKRELKVEFVGNAFAWNSDKNDLAKSVRMAQRLADSLQLRMIDKSRVYVKGSGYNFPYAKTNGPESSKNIIAKANNRIDVYLHNYDPNQILIKKEEFFLNRSLLDTRHTLYETLMDGLTYRVQLNSANFLFREKTQFEFNDSAIEFDPTSGVYTYTVGIYREYKQAKILVEQLLDNYHSNVLIHPYINGLRIEKPEIINYARKHNDLINYLADNK